MLWRFSHYIQDTAHRIRVVPVDRTKRVLVPDGCCVPYAPFLPFLSDDEPVEPVKARYKRKVFRFEVGGEGFYIKKYSYGFTRKHYAPLRGFVWCLPMAQRQLHKLLYLQECGAPVVEPVMAFVQRYGFLKHKSMLVMRECRGVSLRRFLAETDSFDRRLAVVSRTLCFLRLLHVHRVHHGDMVRHKFIVDAQDGVWALDLDERKTKWLGGAGDRRELRKWVKKCARYLAAGPDSAVPERRRAFRRMVGESYPEALELMEG